MVHVRQDQDHEWTTTELGTCMLFVSAAPSKSLHVGIVVCLHQESSTRPLPMLHGADLLPH